MTGYKRRDKEKSKFCKWKTSCFRLFRHQLRRRCCWVSASTWIQGNAEEESCKGNKPVSTSSWAVFAWDGSRTLFEKLWISRTWPFQIMVWMDSVLQIFSFVSFLHEQLIIVYNPMNFNNKKEIPLWHRCQWVSKGTFPDWNGWK